MVAKMCKFLNIEALIAVLFLGLELKLNFINQYFGEKFAESFIIICTFCNNTKSIPDYHKWTKQKYQNAFRPNKQKFRVIK